MHLAEAKIRLNFKTKFSEDPTKKENPIKIKQDDTM